MFYNSGKAVEVKERILSGSLDIGGEGRLEYCLKYPFVAGNKRISSFYSGMAARYEMVIKGRYARGLAAMPQSCRGSSQIDGGYEVMYNKNRLLSIHMDTYENMGQYRMSLGRTSATWDVATGRRLALEQLFKNCPRVRAIVNGRVSSEIAQQQQRCPGSFYYGTGRVKWDWYLTEMGLAVYFLPEVIAPANGGMPSFIIPWDSLAPFAMIAIDA